jgi:hypothetical protein
MRKLAPVLAVLTLAAAPAAAPGQGNPIGPLPAPAPTPPETVVVAPSTDNGDGLKTWQEILIFGAGFILLAGIAWAIVSDARAKAPVKDSELAHPGMGGPVKANRSQKQRERARAKAKMARAQRKRNRGR